MTEYLSTDQVMEILHLSRRQTRAVMQEIGVVRVGHGIVRRDALEKYLDLKTDPTYCNRIVMNRERPASERYARERKEAGK